MSLPVLLGLIADPRGALARPASGTAVTPGAELFADAVRELAPAEGEEPHAAAEEAAEVEAAPEVIPMLAIPVAVAEGGAGSSAVVPPAAAPAPLGPAPGTTTAPAEGDAARAAALPAPVPPPTPLPTGSQSLSTDPAPVDGTNFRQTPGLIVEPADEHTAPAAPGAAPSLPAPALPAESLRQARAIITAPAEGEAASAAAPPYVPVPAGVPIQPKGATPVEGATAPQFAAPAASAPVADLRVSAPADAAPPASAPPAPAPRPALLPQLSGPVVSLARAGDGAHSITLTISPEALGPVTVRARISDGSIRLELHAPSDAGREALRLILADLRRDLAGAAPHATLSVSSQDAPSSSASGSSGSSGSFAGSSHGRTGSDAAAPRHPESSAPAAGREADPMPPAPAPLPHGGIDVYA